MINKILLVLSREYLVRVRKKSFILMTFLTPILLAALFIVPILIAKNVKDLRVIEVIDESGQIFKSLKAKSNNEIKFVKAKKQDLTKAEKQLENSDTYAILYIPKIDIEKPKGIKLIADGSISPKITEKVSDRVNERLEEIRLVKSNIDKADLDKIKAKTSIATENTKGEKKSPVGAMILGFAVAFIIYMSVFIYGSQVMRGVIEEKSNRIIEVMISSVKPFELMMGKILGVVAIGLTQFVLWIILTLALVQGAGMFLNVEEVAKEQAEVSQTMEIDKDENKEEKSGMSGILENFNTMPIALTIGAFLFYFVGGYLLYSSMFAAVASAVDNEADTQQFQTPISMPLIIGFIIAQIAVIQDPDGTIAFWASMVPFTSPIVMMVRIPFGGVDPWELIVSGVLLIGSFIGTTWLAARIYRIGILMHGEKVTYKKLAKWITMKM